MALAATTVWEVRTAGSDTNGGGFVPGSSGTDWSQQNAAQYAVTDGVTAGTTTITSATASFGTDVVGNIIYISGGTGSIVAGWYQIISRTNATTIVVDRSTGLTLGTGVTLNIGGAFASPGQAAGVWTIGNDVWIKNGTYTIGSGTANTAGNKISLTPSASLTNNSQWIGYQTTRGDYGTRPTLQAGVGVTSMTILTLAGYTLTFDNIIADGASNTSVRGFDASTAVMMRRCKSINCSNLCFNLTANAVALSCEASGGSTGGFAIADGCTSSMSIAHGCTTFGFKFGDANISFCIAYSNSGASTDGFLGNGTTSTFVSNTSYGNGRHGFNVGAAEYICLIQSCLATGNAGYGFTATSAASDSIIILNCAGFNNTSGNVNATAITRATENFVTLSGDPFVSAGSNFALNNTAGAGAACRATGLPGAFPAAVATGYQDIGAVQHQDSGGAGGMLFIPDLAGT